MTHVLPFIVAAAVLTGPLAGRAHAVIADALPVLAERAPWIAPPGTPGQSERSHVAQERQERQKRVVVRKGKAVQEATEERTFKVDREPVLTITNLAGDITVTSGPGSEVRVQATRRAYAATEEEARRQLEQTEVTMEQRGNRLEIRVITPKTHDRWSEVAFSVTAPATSTVDVRSLSGDVSLTGLNGDARIETMSGSIVGRELASLSSAKTLSGDIRLANCTSATDMAASSVSGEIEASGLKAKHCDFGSVSGDLGLKRVACDRAVVRSVSGNLAYAGSLGRGGHYEFKTHSGDIELAVDPKIGFAIDARTFAGGLTSDFPLTAPSTGEAGAPGKRQTLRGVFGDGSAEVNVTTFSGNLIVTKIVAKP
jgi:DUF4097 and DUF4098 domain-containing protein YvlB